MKSEINYEMIQLARESRGITQKELAENTSISQGHMSKLERGEWTIPQLKLKKIAEFLEYPESFFYKKFHQLGFGMSFIFHRKRQSISRQILKKIEAQANIKIMQVDSLLDGIDLDAPNEFIYMEIQDYNNSAETVARLLRAKWKLPSGPVKNLIEVLENARAFVFKCDFETNKLDAISICPHITPPIFFLNRDFPADRTRFSLAHELGHLIMHKIPTESLEDEANKFASAFLMPKEDIIHELKPFSLNKAIVLKMKWKVSIAAIVKRAYELGVITKQKYTALFRKINYLGMRLEEPVELPEEKPRLFNRVLEAYQENLGYSIEELSKVLNILPNKYLKMVV